MKHAEHVDDVRKRITWLDAQRAAAVRELEALGAPLAPATPVAPPQGIPLRPTPPSPLRWMEGCELVLKLGWADHQLNTSTKLELNPRGSSRELDAWINVVKCDEFKCVFAVNSSHGVTQFLAGNGKLHVECVWAAERRARTTLDVTKLVGDLEQAVYPLTIKLDLSELEKQLVRLSNEHHNLSGLVKGLKDLSK